MANKRFTITKRIAKHGTQAVIIIPRLLDQELCPGRIFEITFRELKGGRK